MSTLQCLSLNEYGILMNKQKKCKVCKHSFTPWNTLQVTCCPECATKYAQIKIAKREKKRLRERKENLKTHGELVKEVQTAFNAYIRKRDKDKPCVSCGGNPNNNDLLTGSRWDAGHYRSVGACPELRFEEFNCHKQCVKCNQHKSGSAVDYRIELINRIGLEKVEWLEGPHEAKKYSRHDLSVLKKHYRKKARELDLSESKDL